MDGRALGKGDRLTAGSRLEVELPPPRGLAVGASRADHGRVPDGRPDPRSGAGTPAGPAWTDVLEGGLEPPRWRKAWTALSPRGRWAVAAVLALALVVAGVMLLRQHAAEQELRQRVVLTTSFGITSSSTDPPGGSVLFFVLVRNDGPLPVSVTALDGGGQGLGLRMRDAGARSVEAGREIEIPLSVRLTCPAGAGDVTADVRVRRADGGSATTRIDLQPAALVGDVAATLCSVRPDLIDRELSGPVLQSAAGGAPR